ncbi:MAG TPA: type II toxin-antitoxin system ParD family antitoxin [Vitreimonas sp.]|nr:type II toxin-antitoxin system ParD family antitoxin [Vitreimonas sp.]
MSNSITLPPDLAAKVEERVASGEADNAVEVIRAGLAALEADEVRRFEALRAKIERSISDPRPSIPADDVFAEILNGLDAETHE